MKTLVQGPIREVALAALAALVLSVLWLASTSSPGGAIPLGGPMFLSGDDADDSGHCSGVGACGSLYETILDEAVANSNNGGATTDIVAIGVNGGFATTALNNWNQAGHTIDFKTVVVDIENVVLSDYRVVYIPSSSNNTGGGITAAQLAALNGLDIASYVNITGGGVVALTEGGATGAYGWLGAGIALTTSPTGHGSTATITPTAEMNALSPATTATNLTHCCYHNIFTGPSGFLGLDVLAFHDHNSNGDYDGETVDDVIILGGVQVIIQGTVDLTPSTDTNPVGQSHTVTATAEDGSPLVPAVGVTVTFEVTAGPNVGEVSDPNTGECAANNDCTTDANGQVSWTYTGSGGPGTDTISATFVDQSSNTQTSNPVEKIWELVVTPTPGPVTPTPGPSPVGGIVELGVQSGSSTDASESSTPDYTALIAALAAGAVVTVAASGWYARRRWFGQ